VDLDFSREGREENVRRVAEVALLFADAGLIALAALISPYAEGRRRARELHEDAGVRFVEVYVATPVAVCAQRDPKGLYRRASQGEITSFTGLDHPYEAPTTPDLVLGHHLPLAEAVEKVLEALGSAGPSHSHQK
jgi:bifunctional enzyme CysN/CysC